MKTLNLIIVLIISILLLQTSFSAANVISVPSDYSTIKEAISAAASGDTIEIKPGIYKENITLKSNINISGDDSNEVIIRCDSKEAVADIQNCRNVIISKITFTHGQNNPEVEGINNVPILRIKDSSVKINRCKIQDSFGDGIALYGNNQSIITECNDLTPVYVPHAIRELSVFPIVYC